ncbi:hypothetical protein [Pseudomonas syringae]|uniref:hypothetical protein n=1 Tax=Pseudomonas syringae TaxID=317 RepID=UPI001143AE02|nr:hypothetical protein [Pseudomonas syringae]
MRATDLARKQPANKHAPTHPLARQPTQNKPTRSERKKTLTQPSNECTYRARHMRPAHRKHTQRTNQRKKSSNYTNQPPARKKSTQSNAPGRKKNQPSKHATHTGNALTDRQPPTRKQKKTPANQKEKPKERPLAPDRKKTQKTTASQPSHPRGPKESRQERTPHATNQPSPTYLTNKQKSSSQPTHTQHAIHTPTKHTHRAVTHTHSQI